MIGWTHHFYWGLYQVNRRDWCTRENCLLCDLRNKVWERQEAGCHNPPFKAHSQSSKGISAFWRKVPLPLSGSRLGSKPHRTAEETWDQAIAISPLIQRAKHRSSAARQSHCFLFRYLMSHAISNRYLTPLCSCPHLWNGKLGICWVELLGLVFSHKVLTLNGSCDTVSPMALSSLRFFFPFFMECFL